MGLFFVFLFIGGVFYLAVLLLTLTNPNRAKSRLRRILEPKQYLVRFESEKLQTVLHNAGIPLRARNVNLFRYGASTMFLLVNYGSSYFRKEHFGFGPLIFVLIFLLLLSSPGRFTLSGWILRKIHQNRLIQRDGELISFIRLYENNHRKRKGYVQFWAFCEAMAPNFEHIQHMLLTLSERTMEDDLEKAVDWFVSQFPLEHQFIREVRTIILTTEGIDDHEKAIQYLEDQNTSIAKISGEQYSKRWKFIGDISTYITSIPSLATLLMCVVLIILYVQIIRNSVSIN